MDTEAPNISGTYPLAGERVGPAWRAAWALLQEGSWVDGPSLAAEVAGSTGVAAKTVTNLLQKARAHRLLEVRRVRDQAGRHRAEYRVTS